MACIWVTEAKLSAVQLVGLNTLAAEMKAHFRRRSRATDCPVLTALKEAKTPRATSLAALLEAAAAEREGRLDQARNCWNRCSLPSRAT